MDAVLEQSIISFLRDGNCDLVPPAVIARFCPKGQTYNAAARRAAKKKFKTKAKTFALSKSEVPWCFLVLFLLADCYVHVAFFISTLYSLHFRCEPGLVLVFGSLFG